jgi:hypothetical protein
MRRVVVIDNGAGFDFFGEHGRVESRVSRVESQNKALKLNSFSQSKYFWLYALDSCLT